MQDKKGRLEYLLDIVPGVREEAMDTVKHLDMEQNNKTIKKGFDLFSNNPKLTNQTAWLGTACLLFAPYLLSYKIGYVLGALGVAGITPQVVVKKQYNLVILNCTSFVGYTLQILDVL